jgi:hypothetical protein
LIRFITLNHKELTGMNELLVAAQAALLTAQDITTTVATTLDRRYIQIKWGEWVMTTSTIPESCRRENWVLAMVKRNAGERSLPEMSTWVRAIIIPSKIFQATINWEGLTIEITTQDEQLHAECFRERLQGQPSGVLASCGARIFELRQADPPHLSVEMTHQRIPIGALNTHVIEHVFGHKQNRDLIEILTAILERWEEVTTPPIRFLPLSMVHVCVYRQCGGVERCIITRDVPNQAGWQLHIQ